MFTVQASARHSMGGSASPSGSVIFGSIMETSHLSGWISPITSQCFHPAGTFLLSRHVFVFLNTAADAKSSIMENEQAQFDFNSGLWDDTSSNHRYSQIRLKVTTSRPLQAGAPPAAVPGTNFKSISVKN